MIHLYVATEEEGMMIGDFFKIEKISERIYSD